MSRRGRRKREKQGYSSGRRGERREDGGRGVTRLPSLFGSLLSWQWTGNVADDQ